MPQWATADDQQRAMLLDGRHPTAAQRDARQQRVIDTGRAFAAGTADILDLNPAWDEQFLDLCAQGDVTAFDDYDPDEMARTAGNSAHEVRTWVAAFSALAAAGDYAVQGRFYRSDLGADRRVRGDDRDRILRSGKPSQG